MPLDQSLKFIRNGLSVLIAILGLTWIWATKQQHWLKDFIEPSLVVVGSLIALCQFLMQRRGNAAPDNRPSGYNIPNTAANQALLQQAKTAIKEARLSDALDLLAQIPTPSVLEQVTLLNARLSKHEREVMQGMEDSRMLNRLNRDTLSLIMALEKELNTGSDYQKIIKAYLHKRYTKRIKDKMADRKPINLRLLPTTEGTSLETSTHFEPISSEALQGYITGVFKEANGRLLITGVPGAGKTGLLLELALGLLDKTPDQLPVVLNLATWTSAYGPLDNWLQEILPAELGVSKKLAANILQQDQLILLFDGFDEIEEANRASCLEAIGRYGAASHHQFAITSRIAEYKAVAKDAPVYQQIEVGVFTLPQMKAELERLWREEKVPEAKPLLYAIENDATVSAAVEVPFYFNALQLLFAGGKRFSDLQIEGKKVVEIQAAITEQFVVYSLEGVHGQHHSSAQAKRYLSFLAHNMTKRNKVVFELVDLQYDWFQGGWSRWTLLLEGLISALIDGFIGLFFVPIFIGIIMGVDSKEFVFFFLFALTFLLFVGIIYGLANIINASFTYIDTKETVKYSWLTFMEIRRKIFFIVIFGGILGGVLHILSKGIIYGFIGCLYGIFTIGFLIGFIEYIEHAAGNILQINKPYDRFNASMKLLHFSILQHKHLLYLLNKKGLLPYRLVPFLDAMTEQHILESDGATWRFRHRILQEYFNGVMSEER